MAKGRKIEGLATVTRVYSTLVGSMAWETAAVELSLSGETFRWISNGVDRLLRRPAIRSKSVCSTRVKSGFIEYQQSSKEGVANQQ